jgi:hypothetical protein
MKIIKFFAEKDYFNLGQPLPAKKFIPEWYRKAENDFIDSDGSEAPGLKKCMPFLDTLMTGYVLTTPVNIYVNEEKENNSLSHLFNNSENSLRVRWDGPPSLENFIMERSLKSGSTMPRPSGHYDNHLVFSEFWSIKTPRNWSLLVTHPLNRHDLPFTISSGIIDSDKWFAPGNIPFFIKKGFSGLIPEGTPFAQLIPIKRSEWAMTLDKGLADSHYKQGTLARNSSTSYKKIMWQRKKYD